MTDAPAPALPPRQAVKPSRRVDVAPVFVNGVAYSGLRAATPRDPAQTPTAKHSLVGVEQK